MLKNYIKIAWRNLIRSKWTGVINILGLTIGITASLLLFVVIQYELSYDKSLGGYDNIYRIVTLDTYENGSQGNPGVANPVPDALQAERLGFDQVVPVVGNQDVQINIPSSDATGDKEKHKVKSMFFSTPDYVRLFEVGFAVGNPEVLEKPGQALLTESEAVKLFGDWKNVVGNSLELTNGVTLEVAGVVHDLPENSNFNFDILVSYSTLKSHEKAFGYGFEEWGSTSSNFQVYVTMAPGEDEESAQHKLDAFTIKHFEGRGNSVKTHLMQPLAAIHFDSEYEPLTGRLIRRSTVQTLMIIGGFILIMASINFINLSTSKAVGKSREIGVRKVMGSSRGQIMAQSFGETFLSVLIAALLGLCMSGLLLPYLDKIADIPATISFLEPSILVFMLFILGVLTLFSGFYPALVISKFRPVQAMKNKFSAAQVGGIPIRRGLVVMQFAIAQILMLGTLVAVRQMNLIQETDLGFNKEAVYFLEVPRDEKENNRIATFRQELQRVPGVNMVSLSSDMPSSDNNSSTNFYFDQKNEDINFPAFLKFADDSYFELYEMQFAAGQGYAHSDTIHSVVINETMARKLMIPSPEEAIGKTIRIGGNAWVPISGVVKDFTVNSLREEIKQLVITSFTPYYSRVGIKLDASASETTLALIQEKFEAIYPEQIYTAGFLDESIAGFYEAEQKLALVYKIFAGLAILISCIGLYGLVSFMVGQKIKEIGIRKVLGASVIQITFMLSREFLMLVIVAFGIAIPLAYYMMQGWLQTFAYQTPISVGLFVLVIGISLLLTSLTVGSKAIRAALMNPVDSLTDE